MKHPEKFVFILYSLFIRSTITCRLGQGGVLVSLMVIKLAVFKGGNNNKIYGLHCSIQNPNFFSIN